MRLVTRLLPPLLIACHCVAVGALASAQAPTVLLREGDDVFGIGAVTRLDRIAVSSTGVWLAQVDTDNQDASANTVVLQSGLPILAEGLFLGEPGGVSIAGFTGLDLDLLERLPLLLDLAGAITSTTDSGLFLSGSLLIREGDFSIAEVGPSGFSNTTTPFVKFFTAKAGPADEILLLCQVDDPALASATDLALLRVGIDAQGRLASQSVVVKESTPLPDGSITEFISTAKHANAFNAIGQTMYVVDSDFPGLVDFLVMVDGVPVAQEGLPSPWGEAWASLANIEVDLNDRGDWVHTGMLAADAAIDQVISLNGTAFRREGDPVPGFADRVFTSFGLVQPTFVLPDGSVLHFGQWDEIDEALDEGWFLDDRLLVREGVTSADGLLIESLSTASESAALSPDGRFFLFRGTLQGGVDAVFEIDLGTVVPVPDCGGSLGILEKGSGLALTGETLGFRFDQGQGLGVTPILWVSNATVPGYGPCGLMTPYGELIADLASPNPLVVAVGAAWFGDPIDVVVAIPDDSALVNLSFIVQGLFFDVGDHLPGPALRLTNALAVTIGVK